MTGSTDVQRCPFCGEAPMSRLQYLMVPGTRSKCRRCGRAIRFRLTRGQTLMIVLSGVAAGALVTAFTDTALALIVGLVLVLVIGVAFDQGAWRRIPWVPDAQPDAPDAPEAPAGDRPLETADR